MVVPSTGGRVEAVVAVVMVVWGRTVVVVEVTTTVAVVFFVGIGGCAVWEVATGDRVVRRAVTGVIEGIAGARVVDVLRTGAVGRGFTEVTSEITSGLIPGVVELVVVKALRVVTD